MQTATKNCLALLKTTLETDEEIISESCGCRKSLQLAVWTKEKQIDKAAKKRLGVLFE